MQYLLDTHVIIWFLKGDDYLPNSVKNIIDKKDNNIFICAISLWEIAIKVKLGKLDLSMTFDDFIEWVSCGDFNIIPIENKHLKNLILLPPLHKDPFDRLIVATAQASDFILITNDNDIHSYDISWIWT